MAINNPEIENGPVAKLEKHPHIQLRDTIQSLVNQRRNILKNPRYYNQYHVKIINILQKWLTEASRPTPNNLLKWYWLNRYHIEEIMPAKAKHLWIERINILIKKTENAQTESH